MRRTITDRELWDLQLFAEETAESEEPSEEQQEEAKTFTQDEVNEMIKKRLAREKAKLKAETEEAVKTAQAEAAKLAKMNADQKREYEEKKKDEQIAKQQEEIAKLKAETLRAELSRQVGSELQSEGRDAEETKARKDKFISIIQADRKAQAEKRATGTTPKQYGGGQKTDPFANIMKKYNKR